MEKIDETVQEVAEVLKQLSLHSGSLAARMDKYEAGQLDRQDKKVSLEAEVPSSKVVWEAKYDQFTDEKLSEGDEYESDFVDDDNARTRKKSKPKVKIIYKSFDAARPFPMRFGRCIQLVSPSDGTLQYKSRKMLKDFANLCVESLEVKEAKVYILSGGDKAFKQLNNSHARKVADAWNKCFTTHDFHESMFPVFNGQPVPCDDQVSAYTMAVGALAAITLVGGNFKRLNEVVHYWVRTVVFRDNGHFHLVGSKDPNGFLAAGEVSALCFPNEAPTFVSSVTQRPHKGSGSVKIPKRTPQQYEVIQKRRLCLNCLVPGHNKNECNALWKEFPENLYY